MRIIHTRVKTAVKAFRFCFAGLVILCNNALRAFASLAESKSKRRLTSWS